MSGGLSEFRSSAMREPALLRDTSPAGFTVGRALTIGMRQIRAVLFDLDGTLYGQQKMRALMALELGVAALSRPFQARTVVRVLSTFRKAQETLRGGELLAAGTDQADLTARQTGVALGQVNAIVEEWMTRRPLKHLMRCRATGLLPLLDFLTVRGIEIGVFSDYPPALKLDALGLGGHFSLVLCSADAEIGMFKPHPRGFLLAAERWHLDPSEVLVVGDRVDADAAGAAAAGMPCAIVGAVAGRSHQPVDFISVPSLERLRHVLDHDHNR